MAIAAIVLNEANCDEEVGPSQTEIAQGLTGGEVAEIRCQEADEALQRAFRKGPGFRRRGGAVACDDLGEDLLPHPCLPEGLRLQLLPLPLPLFGAVGLGFEKRGLASLLGVGEEEERVGDDVGNGVGESDADAGVEKAQGKHWHVLQRQRAERLLVMLVD